MKPIRHALLGLMSAGLLAAAPLLAQEDVPPRDCKADAEKYCKDVRPGHARLATCLGEHEGALEAKCQEQVTKLREKQAEARQRAEQYAAACEGDVQSFCKEVQPGKGRINKCLAENQGSLSAGCKEAMAQRGEMKAERREALEAGVDACKNDMAQHCADVKPGSGRMNRCLKRNESKLSEGCRAAMKSGGE
jgi:Golgi apparatus protein 1